VDAILSELSFREKRSSWAVNKRDLCLPGEPAPPGAMRISAKTGRGSRSFWPPQRGNMPSSPGKNRFDQARLINIANCLTRCGCCWSPLFVYS
jgi:hypothetical protein